MASEARTRHLRRNFEGLQLYWRNNEQLAGWTSIGLRAMRLLPRHPEQAAHAAGIP